MNRELVRYYIEAVFTFSVLSVNAFAQFTFVSWLLLRISPE